MIKKLFDLFLLIILLIVILLVCFGAVYITAAGILSFVLWANHFGFLVAEWAVLHRLAVLLLTLVLYCVALYKLSRD